MGRGQKSSAGHRCSTAHEGHEPRGENRAPWDSMNPEDDPRCDMRDPEDLPDPVNDDYMWPEYEEEDDD